MRQFPPKYLRTDSDAVGGDALIAPQKPSADYLRDDVGIVPSACQKSPQYTLSFRTSPQTGVGIPRIEVKATGLGSKMFENPGDCHGSVRTASQ